MTRLPPRGLLLGMLVLPVEAVGGEEFLVRPFEGGESDFQSLNPCLVRSSISAVIDA